MTCKASHDFIARSKLTAHSSRRNQIFSPLLRLPAELRNKVYEYALGGWEIRIWYDLTYKIDESKQKSDSTGRVCAACRPASGVKKPWIRARKAVLNLPSVCRQLNAETKMLPFTLNDLGLQDDRYLDHFYYRLRETQRPHVARLRIFLGDFDRHIYPGGMGEFSLTIVDPNKTLGNFVGLEKLVLEAGLCDPCDYDWKHMSDTLTRELVDWIKTSAAHRQQGLNRKTVELTVEPLFF
jgi:hypothetical protein